MVQPPDRFLTVVNFAMETMRTEESTLRSLARSTHRPDPLISSFIDSRRQFYELITNMIGQLAEGDEVEDDDAPLPRIQINVPANWADPVVVAPSNTQLTHALCPIPADVELATCAICQETLDSRETGTQLRNCRHQFHTTCIRGWFEMSVRCPVCRNDIRETQENTV